MPYETEDEDYKKYLEEKKNLTSEEQATPVSKQEVDENKKDIEQYDKDTLIFGGAVPLIASMILGDVGIGAKVGAKVIADRESNKRSTMLEMLKQKANQKQVKIEKKKYSPRDVIGATGDIEAGYFDPESGETNLPIGAPQVKLDPMKYDLKEETILISGKPSRVQFWTDKTNPKISGSRILGNAPIKPESTRYDSEWVGAGTGEDENGNLVGVTRSKRTGEFKATPVKSESAQHGKIIPGKGIKKETKEIAEWEAAQSKIDEYMNVIKSNLKKKDIPGVGLVESNLPRFMLFSSKQKEMRTALDSLLRLEALETGGKNLTPNEKEMVTDAIGYMKKGTEEDLRVGMDLYVKSIEAFRKRIRFGQTPVARNILKSREKEYAKQGKVRSLEEIRAEKEKIKLEIQAATKK